MLPFAANDQHRAWALVTKALQDVELRMSEGLECQLTICSFWRYSWSSSFTHFSLPHAGHVCIQEQLDFMHIFQDLSD